jgi:bifunctional DNA-binding transcriptional regulator/antitoxin component of YhaV-PrlF toxin-antitoxin module
MTVAKIHFDGWLALPATARRKLNLSVGDALTVEVVEESIVLKRATSAASEDSADDAEAVPAPAAPVEKAASGKKARDKVGAAEREREPEPSAPAPAAKPRRRAAAAPAAVKPVLPPGLKARGRRTKGGVAEGAKAQKANSGAKSKD